MNAYTTAQLKEAAQISEQIEALQQRLESVLHGGATFTQVDPANVGKRKLSPEAIAKIRAGQKRRWKKVREAAAQATATPATPAPVATPEPAPVAEPVAA